MPANKVIFPFDFEKAVAALACFASESDGEDGRVTELTRGKASKLMFLADKHHLVKFGRPIFGGEYRAIKKGPVAQEVLDHLQSLIDGAETPQVDVLRKYLALDKRFENPRLKSCDSPDTAVLAATELASLRHIIAQYGKKTFGELTLLTHEMAAYKKAWGDGTTTMVVMSYEDFFEDDADAIKGAFEEMMADFELRSALGQV